jgi:hypothetical protein
MGMYCQPDQRVVANALEIYEGPFFPALSRMLIKGWLVADRGISDHNRRARQSTFAPLKAANFSQRKRKSLRSSSEPFSSSDLRHRSGGYRSWPLSGNG